MKNNALETLLNKINKVLVEKNIKASRASIKAGLGPDFIRKLKNAKNFPKTDAIFKLAKALDTDVNYFLEVIDDNITRPLISKNNALTPIPLKTVYIRGQVQAGNWTEATEWSREKWVPVPMPIDPKYEDLPAFALYVKGDSMNLLYPEGSIVIAIKFSDLGRNPENGECVVTIRRDPLTDCYEATLKIVQIREDGSVLLWPRSNNPDFTKPIQLPRMTTSYQGNGFNGDTASHPDVLIQSLVIWSLNRTGKVKL